MFFLFPFHLSKTNKQITYYLEIKAAVKKETRGETASGLNNIWDNESCIK